MANPHNYIRSHQHGVEKKQSPLPEKTKTDGSLDGRQLIPGPQNPVGPKSFAVAGNGKPGLICVTTETT